ncbi:MAG TPA: TIR domain-containing protein, partial [Thermoanaerobaculia bacterium]|nr:TIR domain-containing protein [Thermoanaerobaculia bacterium]
MDPNERQHEGRSPEVAPVVFISYAREDEAFLRKLTACLEAAGIRPVGDWLLPAAVDYRERLRAFILDSSSFLFAISPDSVGSESCRWELETALEHQKRIVPLVWKEPPLSSVPEALQLRQWIFLRNDSDFERESARLEATIRDDLEGAQEHQYWEERAVDWRDRGSSLLRDKQLQEAERWLERAEARGKDPQPTTLQRAFLKESRRAEARRLWTLRSAVTGVIVILAVAATLLFLQLRKTEEAKAIAEGNLATGLAQIPGRDADALVAALKAAGSNKSGALPIEIADGIANAVASTDLSRILPGHSTQVKSAVLSPDGRILATEADVGSIRIWEFGTGRPLKNFEQKESAILSMDLAAGGRRLVADGSGLAVLWDVPTGKRLAVIKNGSSPGRSRFSRDGTRLLIYSNQWEEDSYVELRSLLDAEDGRKILEVREASPSPSSTSFSPDGSLLAVGLKTGTIQIWSTSTGSLVQELQRRTGPIENITFTPDGKTLVGSGEVGDTALCFWDLETGESRLRVEVSRICRPVFSPNSRYFLCTTQSEEIEARETVSGKLLGTLAMKDTPQVSFAMAGSRLVGLPMFDGKGAILSFPEGKQIKSFEVPASMPGGPKLTADGRRILIVGQDGGIRILDARTGEPVWESVRRDSSLSLLVASRDGEAMVLVGADRIPRLWRSWVDPAFGSLLGLTSPPFEVAFSPDGSRIATSGGGAPLLLWDARTGREIARLGDDFRGAWRVSYSADGRRLVIIGRDNLLRVWDA